MFFGGLVSVLKHTRHFGLLYIGGQNSLRQQDHERWYEGWMMKVLSGEATAGSVEVPLAGITVH